MANAATQTQQKSLHESEARRKDLLQIYKDQPKVRCQASPLYQPYLGKVLQMSINGISIAFPINGSVHEIPQAFADELASRIMAVDNTLNKAKHMSNFSENAEHYAGELQMF